MGGERNERRQACKAAKGGRSYAVFGVRSISTTVCRTCTMSLFVEEGFGAMPVGRTCIGRKGSGSITCSAM